MRIATERILVIGDVDRQIQAAVVQTLPGAQVTGVPGIFDGIAELASGHYTTVLAAAEPIERRPESAVKTLRELAGSGRVLLFGHPTLEPLSRKMLEFGVDDYVVTPATAAELQQVFGTPPMRLGPSAPVDEPAAPLEVSAVTTPSRMSQLLGVPLADVLLDAMLNAPQDSPTAAIHQINSHIAPTMKLTFTAVGAATPGA